MQALKTKHLTPPPSDAMTPSWDLVRKSLSLAVANWEQILYLFLLPSLLYTLGYIMLGSHLHIHHLSDITRRQKLGIGLICLGVLWSLINLGPALYFRVKTTAKHSPTVGECYRRGLRFFWRLYGLYILTGIVILAGLFLIIPGFIFLRRYYLANYYLVDQDLSITAAMQHASHDSAPVSGYVWGILGVQAAFTLAATVFTSIPVAGILLGDGVGYITLFLPVLRYREMVAATPLKD